MFSLLTVRESVGVKVLVVTQHAEPEYVAEAWRSGAAGYILKSELRTGLAGPSPTPAASPP